MRHEGGTFDGKHRNDGFAQCAECLNWEEDGELVFCPELAEAARLEGFLRNSHRVAIELTDDASECKFYTISQMLRDEKRLLPGESLPSRTGHRDV